MCDSQDRAKTQKLLSSLDRIVEDSPSIIKIVDQYKTIANSKGDEGAPHREKVTTLIIEHYSVRSAVSGGSTSLPGIIPLVGPLLALGGNITDMTLLLKFEVEMVLALSYAYGFDINSDEERKMAILLTVVGFSETEGGKNLFSDITRIGGIAAGTYGPREMTKILLSAIAKMTFGSLFRKAGRLIPIVGVVVGAGYNKIMTKKLGDKVKKVLTARLEETKEPH